MDDALTTVARVFERAALPYVVIGGHVVNVWLEPRFTADIDVTVQASPEDTERLKRVLAAEDLLVFKLIANRPKDQNDLQGLARLPEIDWPHVERWAAEWGVIDTLHQLRASVR